MDTLIVGAYGNTGKTFFPGTKRITVYDYPYDFFNLVKSVFNNSQNILIGAAINWQNKTISYSQPQTSITAGTPGSGGAITVGTHSYYLTYVIGSSETIASAKSNIITAVLSTGQTSILTIPLGPTGTTARKVYRTIAGDTGLPLLVTTISDNITTIFTDTIVDTTIVTTNINPPTTSNAYDIDYSATSLPVLALNDRLDIKTNLLDPATDISLGLNRTQEQSPFKLPPIGWQVEYHKETNLAINVNPYYRLIQCSILAGYTDTDIFIKVTCATASSKFKIFATSNTNPTIPTDLTALSSLSVDWFDITNIIFKNDVALTTGYVVIPITGTYQQFVKLNPFDINGQKINPDSFLIAYICANATNFIQVDVNNY